MKKRKTKVMLSLSMAMAMTLTSAIPSTASIGKKEKDSRYVDNIRLETYMKQLKSESVYFNQNANLKFSDNVVLKQITATKEIGVNYYIPAENRYIEGKVTVKINAATVNTDNLTDIPEGYEVINTSKDISIYDGWIYVELQKKETKEITLNFYDEVNGKQVKEETITVEKDAVHINSSTIKVPEGYELTVSGDLGIYDGYVYVGLRPVEIENKAEAILIVNFVGPAGETLDIEPVVVSKQGQEGEWALFKYEEDWRLPEGYIFAADFDEVAANQDIMIQYGGTLDTLEIGIIFEGILW